MRHWLANLWRRFDSIRSFRAYSSQTVYLNGKQLEGAEAAAVADALDEAGKGVAAVFDRLHQRLKAR